MLARGRLILLGILLLTIVAGVAVWRAGWLDRTPAAPPHPLARITASDIATIAVLTPDGAQLLAPEIQPQAAAAIAALKSMPRIDSGSVTWGSATMLRAVTREGVAISLQVKPIDGGAAVRVTADAAPGEAAPDAAAIRTLRLNAYMAGPDIASALLQRAPADAPPPAR